MYTFRLEDHQNRAGVIAGSADDLPAALEGAWQLCCASEDAVIVYDPAQEQPGTLGDPLAVARVSVEWLVG